MCVYICNYMCTCMYVYVYIYVYNICTHIYIHMVCVYTHIYTHTHRYIVCTDRVKHVCICISRYVYFLVYPEPLSNWHCSYITQYGCSVSGFEARCLGQSGSGRCRWGVRVMAVGFSSSQAVGAFCFRVMPCQFLGFFPASECILRRLGLAASSLS